MNHSFIISSNGNETKLFKTLNSFKKQTFQDFEIIIVNNDPTIDKESMEFLRDQFFDMDQLTIVLNSKAQDNPANWNAAIDLATGRYISFVKEGDIFKPNFVENIQAIIANNSIDIIETKMEYNGLFSSSLYEDVLETDRVYDLSVDKNVYAHISQEIYGKIFRAKMLNGLDLKFRRTVRFDTLFIYKALAQARTFLITSQKLISHKSSIVKYSIFDAINQWPHILNYYRSIGTFKALTDELNYAFYYRVTYVVLKQISQFANNHSHKKALKQIATKFIPKINDFIGENKVFLKGENQLFVEYIKNLEKFVTSELRRIK